MKILVTAKRVPDPEQKVKVQGDAIDLSGMNFVVNPFDEYAVEAALRLKESSGAVDEIVVLTIGSKDVTQQLRSCLAMGADRGILVEGDDDSLDSEQTARIIKAVYERESPDLLLMGKQAVDGDNNQVAQLVAGKLDLPQACFAGQLELEGDASAITVGREIDGGMEFKKVPLPSVVTVDLRIVMPTAVKTAGSKDNQEYAEGPRYASLKGIMQAKKKKIDEISVGDLGVELEQWVKTTSVETPPSRSAGIKVESVDELVDKLQNEAKVL
ncbi:MAG: electron transfer flavoprotein subunit beta/FixA family protein [Myxococcales bacterium]|nr:electron transfer flavoprotein subunit beta/FixA family protein [Myxococcales bacterium]